MDIFTLAGIFSARTGAIYSYTKPVQGNDVSVEVTAKISQLLGDNNFTSLVTEYKGVIYAYVSRPFPEDSNAEDFYLIGDVAEGIEEYSNQQLLSLQQLAEEQDPEEQQNAS